MNKPVPGPQHPVAVVLAAGKGTRMRSDLPKVLHTLAGRPLIDHVLDLAERFAPPEAIVVVVGHGAEEVAAHVRPRGVRTALQVPQLGTGDALRVGLEGAPDGDPVVVLSGDVPGLTATSVQGLLDAINDGGDAALLTAELPDPGAYGRVVRAASGRIEAVVEARDADAATLAVTEVNAGVYGFRRSHLANALAALRPDNAQGEYYLTDVVRWFTAHGLHVAAKVLDNADEMQGVNTRDDLARLARLMA